MTTSPKHNPMLEELPDVLQIIADAAGLGVALTLAKAHGGTRITIPKKVTGSPLADLVGIEAAEKIAKALGNGPLLVPMGPVCGERGRREVMRRAFAAGATAKSAALTADVSERTAWRLKAKMKKSGPETLPLFSNKKSRINTES